MEGFNIRFKFEDKYILGITQDDLTITAETKESYTKDMQGTGMKTVARHNVTFSMSGLYEMTSDGAEAAELGRNEIIAMALKKGDEGIFGFSYGPEGGDIYEGQAIITSYKESSNANPGEDATISLDCEVVGEMTKAE